MEGAIKKGGAAREGEYFLSQGVQDVCELMQAILNG